MNEKYVALDVHKASVPIGVRDGRGKYIMESIVETKAVTLLKRGVNQNGTRAKLRNLDFSLQLMPCSSRISSTV